MNPFTDSITINLCLKMDEYAELMAALEKAKDLWRGIEGNPKYKRHDIPAHIRRVSLLQTQITNKYYAGLEQMALDNFKRKEGD